MWHIFLHNVYCCVEFTICIVWLPMTEEMKTEQLKGVCDCCVLYSWAAVWLVWACVIVVFCTVEPLYDWSVLVWLLCFVQLSRCMTGLCLCDCCVLYSWAAVWLVWACVIVVFCTVEPLYDWSGLVWLLCFVQLSRCMTGLGVCSAVKSFRCCSIIRSHSDIWSLSSMASVHVHQLRLNQVGIVYCPADNRKVHESLVFSENARHLR